MGRAEAWIGRYLAAWTDAVSRRAPWVILIFFALAAASTWLAVNRLGVNTDTADMLQEDLPFRQTLRAYQEHFPQLSNALLIVIDGRSQAEVREATERLSQRLEAMPEAFKSVYLPGGGAFFKRQGLLYLPPETLRGYAGELATVGPVLARLEQAPSAQNLFTTLSRLRQEATEQSALPRLDALLEALNKSLESTQGTPGRVLRWDRLLAQDMAQDTHNPGENTGAPVRQLIVVQPRLDFSNLFAAGPAMRLIRETGAQADIDAEHGLRLRITGGAALAYEELKSVSQGMGTAALIALCMIIVLLWFAMRSLRMMLAAFITLLVGLSLTAGFAALAIGSLNLISVAFTVLYIGLGIDFAIHLSLRYEELRREGRDTTTALRLASGDVGASLALCAASTAIGFYAFTPTAFTGVSELGWISGTGMLISLVVSLSLLPALLSIWPATPAPNRASKSRPLARFVGRLPSQQGALLRLGALALVFVSLPLVPQLRFDYDLLNLRDAASESVQTYRDLLAEGPVPPWRLTVLADNNEEAGGLREAIGQLPSVDRVASLNDLIPTAQDEKLAIIHALERRLGTPPVERPDRYTTSTLASLEALQQALTAPAPSLPDTLAPGFERLARNLDAALEVLEALPAEAREQALRRLDADLMGTLGAALTDIHAALAATPIDTATLPEDLLRRWVSDDDTQRLVVFARDDLSDAQALRRFVDQVSALTERVTDTPAISLAAGDAAVKAFTQAFITAGVLISLLLILVLRSVIDTLLVLTPLLLAGLLTAAGMVLLDIPFNFANIIALPLLLGIGVDSGIHMVSRARTAAPGESTLLLTSTARAVILSALTTVIGFGNLSFSSHPGTASMGQVLTLGVLLTMACTVLVLPALLAWRQRAPQHINQGE